MTRAHPLDHALARHSESCEIRRSEGPSPSLGVTGDEEDSKSPAANFSQLGIQDIPRRRGRYSASAWRLPIAWSADFSLSLASDTVDGESDHAGTVLVSNHSPFRNP